ncbi:MAG TPA: phosphoribosylanthranilate isomerase [Xanthobacteraceae bacterium]|nr:phosphoribosylanthranilate isomerase [Xanthobacteraceae bacterium]
MIEVKICGIKDLAAMDAALEAGADLVGLVFFPPSPRAVTMDAAAKLAARARGRARVTALVVDANDSLLAGIVEHAKPDLLQLHGAESTERVAAIRSRFGRPVMKAIPVAEAADLRAVPDYEAVADRILFDARPPKDANRPGGHGRAFDWALLAGFKRKQPMMLSGGLTPENVAEAIAIVRPDAVDVSSGVERAPGEKDLAKIASFVKNARAAAAALGRPQKREKVS